METAPPKRSRRSPASIVWGLRLAGSGLVLAVLFVFVPFEQVWTAVRQLPPWLWLGALVGFLIGHLAAAAKWRLLIGPGVSFSAAFRAHLAGLAANLCLPGVAGGDVVRAGLVYRSAQNPAQLAIGSVVDRILDTLGLAIIAAASGVVAFGARGEPRLVAVLLLGGALAVAGLACVALLAQVLRRWRPEGRIGNLLAKVAGVADELIRRPGRLALCLTISMAVQIGFIGINLAFAAAAHVDAPAVAWAFAWATAKIVAIAPISLGGLGVREASMAGLLAPFGADPAKVIAVGLIWQTVLYASGALGALAQLFWRPDGARSGEPQPPGVLPEAPR